MELTYRFAELAYVFLEWSFAIPVQLAKVHQASSANHGYFYSLSYLQDSVSWCILDENVSNSPFSVCHVSFML